MKDAKFIKEKFDKEYPGAKMVRAHELRNTTRLFYANSPFGKIAAIIYLVVALGCTAMYWKFFGINFFLSLFFGVITWFVITYAFDKLFIKLFGVEKAFVEANDRLIEEDVKRLEEMGVPMDKIE
ncbi:MAG: hypothetical protein Q7S32_01250 [bacterium]|nr:hypothetical protein [bacterium]